MNWLSFFLASRKIRPYQKALRDFSAEIIFVR